MSNFPFRRLRMKGVECISIVMLTANGHITWNGVTAVFLGQENKYEPDMVDISVLIPGLEGAQYGPQGGLTLDQPSMQFEQDPRWAMVIGTVTLRVDKLKSKGKDETWYVHFKGVFDVYGKPKGFDEDVIAVYPNSSSSG